MNAIKPALTCSILLALAACGGTPDSGTSQEADAFAARINGQGAAADATPQPASTPTVAKPLPNAAEGAFAPGTATDPEAATCDANRMGPFIGMLADAQTRTNIEATASSGREIRFISPGGDYINPDPTNPRLNIMLDAQDIIRDARCG